MEKPVTEQEELDAAVAAASRAKALLLVRWTAPWCPLCADTKLEVEDCVRAFGASACSVDLADAGELALAHGVKRLPRVFVYSEGKCVADVVGRKEGAVRDACREHAFATGVANDDF